MLTPKANIFIIGHMGAGKTKIGKALAKTLSYQFLDTDAHISKAQNIEISQIFQEKGEPYFRALEHQYLQDLNATSTVISTGGGMPCFSNNISILKSKGLVVYLSRPIPDLLNNLAKSKKDRPILKGLNTEEQYHKLNDLVQQRSVFYKQAHIEVALQPYEQGQRAVAKIMELSHSSERFKKSL